MDALGAKPISKSWYKYNPKPCQTCGKEFKPNNSSHVHCGEECKQRSLRVGYLRRNYGISVEEYDSLLSEQGGVCAICSREEVRLNKYAEHSLAVDHCHSTGKIRGLLCANCNRGLGLFSDNVEWLSRSITYLEANK